MAASKNNASDRAASAEPAGETQGAAQPGFDARLAALEAVAAELEAGDLPLERAIERYQQGIALLQQCQQELDGYKQKVEELSEQAEAALRARDATGKDSAGRDSALRDTTGRDAGGRASSGAR